MMTSLPNPITSRTIDEIERYLQHRQMSMTLIVRTLRKFPAGNEHAIRVAQYIIGRSTPDLYTKELFKQIFNLNIPQITDAVIERIREDRTTVYIALLTAAEAHNQPMVERLRTLFTTDDALVEAAMNVCVRTQTFPALVEGPQPLYALGVTLNAEFIIIQDVYCKLLSTLVGTNLDIAFHPQLLYHAIETDKWEIVNTLLKLDRNCERVDVPLSIAIRFKRFRIAGMILDTVKPRTPLPKSVNCAIAKNMSQLLARLQQLNKMDLSQYLDYAINDIKSESITSLIFSSTNNIMALVNRSLDRICTAGWVNLVRRLIPCLQFVRSTRFGFIGLGICSTSREINEILAAECNPTQTELLIASLKNKTREQDPTIVAPFISRLTREDPKIKVYYEVLTSGVGDRCATVAPDAVIWGCIDDARREQWLQTLNEDVREAWFATIVGTPLGFQMRKFGYIVGSFAWSSALRCAKPL